MKNLPLIWLKKLSKQVIANDKITTAMRVLKQKSVPLFDRWNKFTIREKRLLLVLIGATGLFVLYTSITSLVVLEDRLNAKNLNLQGLKISSEYLKNEYDALSQISANSFSSVSLSRIQGDVKQALNVDNADVQLQEGVLTIKSDNVMFDSVMLLLDQLKRSYGIYPTKLKITQSRSGYVNFNVTFMVSQ